MNDLTIIIPVHEYNIEVKGLLINAVNSIPNKTNVLIICNNIIINDINNDFNKKTYKTIGSDKTSFTELVNLGVDNVKTKWFSILEFDDEYSPIWFPNVEKYITFNPDVSIFMPLTDLFDFQKKQFIGYGNEAVWASSFSNDLGFIDNDCLQNFFDFYMTGSVFNTDDWKEYGGLKNSIKLTFWYEFLLRMTYNNKKIMVIPRVGYTHNLNREGSLINTYSNTIDENESQGWIEIAKQEYVFKTDRNKVYQKITNEKE